MPDVPSTASWSQDAANAASAGGPLGVALASKLGTKSVYTTYSLDSIGRRTALRMR